MKPSQFDYIRPETVEDAVKALATHGDRAKVLAGGQSLIPMMNFRLAAPEVLVDIARIPTLSSVEAVDGTVRIGAGTRHNDVMAAKAVRQHVPLLAAAYAHVAHNVIRNRGTIGGNVCHNDPASEVPMVLTVLGATMHLAGTSSTRTLPAEDFFVDAMETATAEDELLVRIGVPFQTKGEGWSFHEMSNRKGDWAMAAAAVRLRVVDGSFAEVRVGITGAGPAVKRMPEVEAALEGRPASDETIAAAAALAAERADPTDGVHGDVAYNRDLIRAMGRRALTDARHRATGA